MYDASCRYLYKHCLAVLVITSRLAWKHSSVCITQTDSYIYDLCRQSPCVIDELYTARTRRRVLRTNQFLDLDVI